MLISLNNKESKRFRYYFSNKIRSKKYIFVFNYLIVILLSSSLILSLFFISRINNSEISYLEEDFKINNIVFALNDIYRYKNLSSYDLQKLSHLIDYNSKKYEIEPELIIAIISVESSFNKTATSRVGALGLMQIMPATFNEAAAELGLTYKSADCIYDIENNITIGTYYLSKLLNKYNNDFKLAILAYNWGPTNIDRFLRNKQNIPLFYYNKVMDHYKRYVL